MSAERRCERSVGSGRVLRSVQRRLWRSGPLVPLAPLFLASFVTPFVALGCKASMQTSGAEPGPRAVTVPAELLEQTNAVELSGVAWASALGRFLLVSDDVATDKAGKKHLPWVLTMSVDGTLDGTPMAIEGIDELNDPESICAGPPATARADARDGTFFVVTSHSINKHGHRSAARRRLLHLGLSGHVLRVLGQVDLTEARGTQGESLLGIANLPDDGRLDIEAITWENDALYIGLKSPLAGDGAATILRMGDAVRSLADGRIAAGSVTLWSRARLCRGEGASAVCEGIADMAFVDGALLLVANSPKGMPADGGGALWRMAGPGATPMLVRAFPGLKPEGISRTSDGRTVVVVFDTDRATPMWWTWKF